MTGRLGIAVDSPLRLSQVADRVTAWAGSDAQYIRTTSMIGPSTSLWVPQELSARGPLYLRRNGPDLWSLRVEDSDQVLTVGNGDSTLRDPNVSLEEEIAVELKRVDGYTYEFQFWNATGHGDLCVDWHDYRGLQDQPTVVVTELPPAEKITHTYVRPGTYRLTVCSLDGYTSTETWVKVPYGAGLPS